MAQDTSRSDYVKLFEGELAGGERHREALRLAHEIRKFEIELYWKRAAYFWTFIAAALAGYFTLQEAATEAEFTSTYIVACLGFVFSLAWYLVNRGSKSWQRNWEAQVDLLEDEISGPLYKTEVNRYDHKLVDLTTGYHFSPSRINQLLGVIISLVWLGLIARTVVEADWSVSANVVVALTMSVLTVGSCAAFWMWGRSAEPEGIRSLRYTIRRYEK